MSAKSILEEHLRFKRDEERVRLKNEAEARMRRLEKRVSALEKRSKMETSETVVEAWGVMVEDGNLICVFLTRVGAETFMAMHALRPTKLRIVCLVPKDAP